MTEDGKHLGLGESRKRVIGDGKGSCMRFKLHDVFSITSSDMSEGKWSGFKHAESLPSSFDP
tara:strand:+ start:349 stop:534 length:186 start_codon:yes stop_codon:yes gene_type:complete